MVLFIFGLVLGFSCGGWAMHTMLMSGLEKLMKDRVLVLEEGLDND